MSTDEEWEQWGRENPYYGVFAADQFRRQNLTEDAKQAFFESGRRHVDHVLEVCRERLDSDFVPRRVLDFGCGNGRLLIPLAAVAERVVGLDVSDSMLREAATNCAAQSVTNVRLFKSDDELSCLQGRFDLVHSFVVFQHIPVERGVRLFRLLLGHLEDGGICAVQFTYAKAAFASSFGVSPRDSTVVRVLKEVKRFIRRRVRRVARIDPEMQMNPYRLNELLFSVQSLGIRNLHIEFTDHGGGELGVFLLFQKPRPAALAAAAIGKTFEPAGLADC